MDNAVPVLSLVIALLESIDRLIRIVLDPQKRDPLGDFTGALQQTTSLAQSVLKREWERVKNEGVLKWKSKCVNK